MIRPLFLQSLKSNKFIWLAFTLLLCVFITVMCNVFTPENMAGIGDIAAGTSAGSFFASEATLISYIANTFFAIMAILFPMLYTILTANRLIASKVDTGEMAGLLATPAGRFKIVFTQWLYLTVSLFLMWVVVELAGITMANTFQGEDALDIEIFSYLNLGCFLYHFAISGISFFASCFFNASKNAMALGGGLPLVFFFISLLVKLSDDLDVLRYFTLNTLFDTKQILEGSGFAGNFVIFALIGVVLAALGMAVFYKKDLPL